MNTKFKLGGYIFDFEVPLMFIGICVTVGWVIILPMSFDEYTPWYMFPLWIVGTLIMMVWVTKKPAKTEETE